MVRAVVRLRRLRYTAEPLHLEEAIRDPYRVKVLRKVRLNCDKLNLNCHFYIYLPIYSPSRYSTNSSFLSLPLKVIDGCAFRVYGHWVKKGEGQNRAALFENMPRTELRAFYIANLAR